MENQRVTLLGIQEYGMRMYNFYSVDVRGRIVWLTRVFRLRFNVRVV